MNKFNFDNDVKSFLLSSFDEIYKNENYRSIFDEIINAYKVNANIEYEYINNRLSAVDLKNRYTYDAILIILLFIEMRNHYRKNNISDDIWNDTVIDIKYKIDECKLVKGVCGIFVTYWYIDFLKMRLFGFGRLQFQIYSSDRDLLLDGESIKKGDFLISIHIPRSGERLDYNKVKESYKMAYFFFKKYTDKNYIPFICYSWLLLPDNKKMLNENSNIYKFMNDFTLLQYGYDKDYNEIWRLFDKEYSGNFDDLPNDTSLRRNYIRYFKSGGMFGYGLGIFIYKNNNIAS